MGDITKIQWTDHTFNPWVGCTKVHAGCTHCYAEADMDKRRHFAHWGPNGTRVITSESNWRKPEKWNREATEANEIRRVFCSSLADVFEDWKGDVSHSGGNPICRRNGDLVTLSDVRKSLFDLIDETPNLNWQLLTKRPENIIRMWPLTPGIPRTLVKFDESGKAVDYKPYDRTTQLMYRPNVWLGTSVSDQETADQMIPRLIKCRDLSPCLFISYEPAIGPVDLSAYLEHLDWVIVGGESGPHARPFCVEWADSVVNQCGAAGVSVFVKQLGSNPRRSAGAELRMHILDRKGGDISEWPGPIRVRQFPEVVVV